MFSTSYNKEAKLWSGRDVVPLYNPKISLGQVLLNSMTIFGPKIAQINDNNGIQLTFDDIHTRTVRAAQNLQKLGYEPKQVFGMVAKNSHHVAPIMFASICIGCPINTLDPSFGKVELLHMLNTTKPVLMFCDVENYDLVKECLIELGNAAMIFTFGGRKGDSKSVEDLFIETHKEDQFLPVKVNGENDTAVIICSSGTTGLSKGVCLSHAAILDAMSAFDVQNSSDVTLCFSSLYWLSGLIILLKGTLIGGCRIITTEPYSPELQLKIIEQHKVTTTMNAPYQIVLLMKDKRFNETDLSSLKHVMLGGSKVPFHVQAEFNSRLPNGSAHVGYGMSEIAGVISVDFPGPSGRDSVGRLSSGVKMKIIDDQGNRCGPNVDGEICWKTNYKFLGYYGNEKATAEVFDSEGFLMTGDIGHFDDDGYLYIVDRKKDMLKYRGFQISPSAIDGYLLESPHIKSACVVGVPDEMHNDLPAAVVVRADGSNISEKEVFDLVADHFADYYKLRGGIYFVGSDNLPTTPSGKVLRRRVRETAISLYNARRS